jgi:hypothetical protein
MAFSVTTTVQGAQVIAPVSLTGDEFSISTAIAGGATEVTNTGVIPDSLVEVVIVSDVACTVDCGSNAASTIAANIPMVWCTGCGLTAPFAGSSILSFTIVNSNAEVAGTVKIMGKTSDS